MYYLRNQTSPTVLVAEEVRAKVHPEETTETVMAHFISLNRAHHNIISEGAGNMIFWVHVCLRVVSKASRFQA